MSHSRQPWEPHWASNLAITAMIAALPVLASLVRSYFLARGEQQTFTVLASNLNLFALYSSTLLVLAGMAGLLASALYLFRPLWRNGLSDLDESDHAVISRITNRQLLAAFALATPALVAFFPWQFSAFLIVGNAVLISTSRILHARERKKADLPEDEDKHEDEHELGAEVREWIDAARKRPILVAFSAILVLGIGSILLPPSHALELAVVAGEDRPSLGYVVSVDDTSVTLLYDSGGLRRILNRDIEERAVCPLGSPAVERDNLGILDGRPVLLLLLSALDLDAEYTPPICTTPAALVNRGT